MELGRGTFEHSEDEAFVIVKAAPRVSKTHGETVCIAAIDTSGQWIRLYPVSFQSLAEAQRFGRWDRIRFRWRKPRHVADKRQESRRVDDRSISIVGTLPKSKQDPLVNRMLVTSLRREHEEGRSLAFLRPEIVDFRAVRRTAEELAEHRATYATLAAQGELVQAIAPAIMRPPSPFAFKYRYRDDDGLHWGTCQDWETEATFMARLRDQGSEAAALEWMQSKFGDEYPRLGMSLAMGTNRWRPKQWLVNGVIRYNVSSQPQLL